MRRAAECISRPRHFGHPRGESLPALCNRPGYNCRDQFSTAAPNPSPTVSTMTNNCHVRSIRRTIRAYLAPACIAACFPILVAAQSPQCDAAKQAVHPAPAAALQAARPADGTTRYTVALQGPRETTAKTVGSMIVTQVTTRCGSDGVVQRVTVTDFGMMGRVTDTTLSVASTLAPIRQRASRFGRSTALDFSGAQVRGSTTGASGKREVRDALAAPAFNSADLAFVIRSLALRPGLSTTLQIYSLESGGSSPTRVDVQRLEPASGKGGEGTWVVRSRSPGVERTYRIGERSRMLRVVEVAADSTTFRTTLVQ